MSDQTNRILIKLIEDEEFIEVYTSHSKSFEKYIRRNKKSRQYKVDEKKNSIT